tara:strand:- start:381 stop:539 length:159 start_codon:yes stop_codon:yes gene_type:complete
MQSLVPLLPLLNLWHLWDQLRLLDLSLQLNLLGQKVQMDLSYLVILLDQTGQ